MQECVCVYVCVMLCCIYDYKETCGFVRENSCKGVIRLSDLDDVISKVFFIIIISILIRDVNLLY